VLTRAKLLRVVLPFLLAASVLTTASPSASAAPPTNGYYGCNSGSYESSSSGSGRYQISSGSVTNGSSCAGAVIIPDGVTSVGDLAFYPATALTSITIPNSVTSIGVGAFAYTTALTSITIPNSVTSISDFAFYFTTALTSITIPNSVTSIGDFAFYFTTALTSITIPDSVTSIGDYAFYFATALTSITIPNSVTSVGSHAFNSATSLTSLTIPDSVTTLGNDTFYNTTSLTQYTYCGTSLTENTLNNAGLNGKTKNCAPVYVPPMLPSIAPTISINDGVITCTAGEYSRAATSVVFSLFVDGNHVATNFSSTGDYLPSWLAVWADPSTIQRTASLTSASWNIGIAGNASRASCWTLAYSQHATGLISSDSISLP